MIFKSHLSLCAIIALIINACPLLAELTTLMHYDPAPIFSANDSMLPPNSQFLDLKQARYKKEKPNKRRAFGINISGFVQGANSAVNSAGVTYGTINGDPEPGFEMGDFRGTLYAMGLFLGKNPDTGYNIWTDNDDTGVVTDISTTSINNFLPSPKLSCLNLSATNLSAADNTPGTNGLIFNGGTAAQQSPSIFSQTALDLDATYFGAFSLPIQYRKSGMRFEVNLNCWDYVQFTFQGGFANIKQFFKNTIASQTSTSTTCAATGQTAYGPYSISDVETICPSGGTTPQPLSELYYTLARAATVPPDPFEPDTTAQGIFNDWISDNLDNLLSSTCGINQGLCNFDEYSAEDLRFYITFQCPFDPTCFNGKCDEHEDDNDWPDMVFTPFIWAGGTAPVAKKTDYNQLLSLAFGNNGHASVGAGGGMTFDFAEAVEVGFDGGFTYFFTKCENRPFPTHPLQRVVYPFRTDINTKPGINWNFRALLNAYQFMKHCSFWFTYEIVEHRKDCFTVCDSTKAQYFYPDVLTCISDWRAQFFNAALVFDFQPSFQASLAWQQPISPRNAYYPVSIVASVNFLF